MVKSWVCPQCLGDLDTFYIEEGDTMVTNERIICPTCGYTLEGAISECCREEAPTKDSSQHIVSSDEM